MKLMPALLTCCAALAFGAAPNPQVKQVRTVYLLPMSNGFDQYLANRLTNLGIYQVVADPKKADAVFTDALGEAFEARLKNLFPQPSAAADSGDDAKGEMDESAKKAEPSAAAADNVKNQPGVPVSSFRRAKGTVFLVDANERTVIWSTYMAPRGTSPAVLDRVAGQVVNALKREVSKK